MTSRPSSDPTRPWGCATATRCRVGSSNRPASSSEKDANLAQKLGQLQPFIAISSHECLGQLASVGPGTLTPFSVQDRGPGRGRRAVHRRAHGPRRPLNILRARPLGWDGVRMGDGTRVRTHGRSASLTALFGGCWGVGCWGVGCWRSSWPTTSSTPTSPPRRCARAQFSYNVKHCGAMQDITMKIP